MRLMRRRHERKPRRWVLVATVVDMGSLAEAKWVIPPGGWMDGWMDDGWMDGWMGESGNWCWHWMDGWRMNEKEDWSEQNQGRNRTLLCRR
ncbi:hypothetical protein IWZ03DRAFT_30190 [Phyllosticta citriasiana]|uniref:Uncharacterized protein n=1 Tax=Phyllosticta citriasiana TaxID=595635 RepID=A0ABR1L0M6_9PEZI